MSTQPEPMLIFESLYAEIERLKTALAMKDIEIEELKQQLQLSQGDT